MYDGIVMAELDAVVAELPDDARELAIDMASVVNNDVAMLLHEMGGALTERDRAGMVIALLLGSCAQARADASLLASAVRYVCGPDVFEEVVARARSWRGDAA